MKDIYETPVLNITLLQYTDILTDDSADEEEMGS